MNVQVYRRVLHGSLLKFLMFSRDAQRIGGLLMVALFSSVVACVKAPNIVVVDRETALEEQVLGEYRSLLDDLREAELKPGPLPYTRGQIEASGWDVSHTSLEALVQTYGAIKADSEVVDALLVRRCIGEANDGTLVETPATCLGEVDPQTISPLLQRVNRNRRQLWTYMLAQAKGASLEDVIKAWRKNHLATLPCRANIQTEGGEWTLKACEEESP